MSGWISVNDKSVAHDQCVDVWVESQDMSGRLCNCFYNVKNNKFWYWGDKCKNKIQIYADLVTHWMPLPEPPSCK